MSQYGKARMLLAQGLELNAPPAPLSMSYS